METFKHLEKEFEEKINILKFPRMDIKTTTSRVLRDLGVKPNIRGYRYLVEAVYMCYTDRSYMENITKVLYRELGKKFNNTDAGVERNMRTAIHNISNAKAMDRYFSGYVKDQYSNKEFLALMVEYLDNDL